MSTSRPSIVRSTAVVAAATIGTVGALVFSSAVLARAWTPEQFTALGAYRRLSALLAIFPGLIGLGLIRGLADARATRARLVLRAWAYGLGLVPLVGVVALLAGLVVVLPDGWVGRSLGQTPLHGALYLVEYGLLFLVFADCRADERFVAGGAWQFWVAGLAPVAALLWADQGLAAYLRVSGYFGLPVLVVPWVLNTRRFPIQLALRRPQVALRMVRFASSRGAASLGVNGLLSFGVFVLGASRSFLAGATLVAAQTMLRSLDAVTNPIGTVLFPRVIRDRAAPGEREKLRVLFAVTVAAWAMLLAAPAFGLQVGVLGVRLLFGPRYEAQAVWFVPFLIASGGYAAYLLLRSTLDAIDDRPLHARIALGGLAVSVLVCGGGWISVGRDWAVFTGTAMGLAALGLLSLFTGSRLLGARLARSAAERGLRLGGAFAAASLPAGLLASEAWQVCYLAAVVVAGLLWLRTRLSVFEVHE